MLKSVPFHLDTQQVTRVQWILGHNIVVLCYIGECRISILNVNNGIKERTHGHQNCNTGQILTYPQKWETHFQNCNTSQMSKWESLCTFESLLGSRPFQPILILNGTCLSLKVLAWYINLVWVSNTNISSNIHTFQMVSKNVKHSL